MFIPLLVHEGYIMRSNWILYIGHVNSKHLYLRNEIINIFFMKQKILNTDLLGLNK